MGSQFDSPASESWFRKHSSVVYVAVLLIVSLTLLVIAFLVQPPDNQQQSARAVAANLLFTFSALFFAAVVGTVFFSLPDVREKLAATFAELLSQGRIVRMLARKPREAIERELALTRVTPGTHEIVESLRLQSRSSADQAYQSVHFQNYQVSTTLQSDAVHAGLIRASTVITFRAMAHHLAESRRSFRYRFVYQLGVPTTVDIEDSDVMPEFTATFGERTFTRRDVKNKRIANAEPPQVLFEFDKEIRVPGQIDARVTIEVLYEQSEDSDYEMIRYPSHGFSCELHYRNDFDYDYTWFSGNRAVSGDFTGKEQVSRFQSGIRVSTHDWMLPGEGVVLIWKPKQKPQAAPSRVANVVS